MRESRTAASGFTVGDYLSGRQVPSPQESAATVTRWLQRMSDNASTISLMDDDITVPGRLERRFHPAATVAFSSSSWEEVTESSLPSARAAGRFANLAPIAVPHAFELEEVQPGG